MNRNRLGMIFLSIAFALALQTACEKPAVTPKPDPEPEPKPDPEVIVDTLPEPLAIETYSPSLCGKPYRPIWVEYGGSAPVKTWNKVKTRILPYVVGFTPDTTIAHYKSVTNKYGSRTDYPKQEATGRFRTQKIDGRWWIIDPEGYQHYQRSVTSLRKGSSERNEKAWKTRFAMDSRWIRITQSELAGIGFHGTGAFCTNAYDAILAHDKSNPDSPLTLAPSFGFLGAFRKQYSYDYPDGKSDNLVGLVFYPKWSEFCESYIKTALAPYLNNPNVLGFFSDNEINFTSSSSKILSRFLAIADTGCHARAAAVQFMADKGATTVTSALNDEFAGIVAEKYYKAVKEAIKRIDPGMMYLGSRLHGSPKYMQGVVTAAGKYCDIVSINYYSRWSPELTTYVKNWDEWADAPFLVTEFYTKGIDDSDLPNTSGAGFSVHTQADRAYAYQHFTLGLLEAKNCVGWHWFKYQDDDGTDNDGQPANKGVYDNYYNMYPRLARFMKAVNLNVYEIIKFFDEQQ